VGLKPTPNVKRFLKKTLGVHVLESMFCRSACVSIRCSVSFLNKEIGKILETFSLSSLNLTNFANLFLIYKKRLNSSKGGY